MYEAPVGLARVTDCASYYPYKFNKFHNFDVEGVAVVPIRTFVLVTKCYLGEMILYFIFGKYLGLFSPGSPGVVGPVSPSTISPISPSPVCPVSPGSISPSASSPTSKRQSNRDGENCEINSERDRDQLHPTEKCVYKILCLKVILTYFGDVDCWESCP